MRVPEPWGRRPWELATRTVRKFLDDDMTTYAAALAFHMLLALVPFVIFLLSFLGALGLPDFFDRLRGQVQAALPDDTFRGLVRVVGEVRERTGGGLISFGLLVAFWSASAGVRSLMHAFNLIYGVAESRPARKLYPLSLLYTIGLAALLIAAVSLMLVGPGTMRWLAGYFGLAEVVVGLWTWLRWPAAGLLLLLTIDVVYYVAPTIRLPFRLITPGSILAVAAWVVASVGFSAYVATFGSYGATYGSLGGAIVLLLYFFISGLALLLGAEVNAILYRDEVVSRGS